MKRVFGLVLERLVFVSKNLKLSKCRKQQKKKKKLKTKPAVSERRIGLALFWLERLGFGFLHSRSDQHKNNGTVCEDADLEGGVFQHQAEWSRLRFQLGVCMPATVLPQ